MVPDVLGGYNGTIFAYGQTSSGKTHTMEVRHSLSPRQNHRVPNIWSQISQAVCPSIGVWVFVWRRPLTFIMSSHLQRIRARQSLCNRLTAKRLNPLKLLQMLRFEEWKAGERRPTLMSGFRGFALKGHSQIRKSRNLTPANDLSSSTNPF